MRALALHEDVLLVTSAVLRLNCVIVRAAAAGASAGPGEVAGETFVVDSPILPDELELLPSLLAQAGYAEPSGSDGNASGPSR